MTKVVYERNKSPDERGWVKILESQVVYFHVVVMCRIAVESPVQETGRVTTDDRRKECPFRLSPQMKGDGNAVLLSDRISKAV